MREKSRFYQTSASGKVILIGEHAVVHGAQAVALPLSGIRMNLEMFFSDSEVEHSFFVRGKKLEKLSVRFQDLLAKACALFGQDIFKASFRVQSDILIGSGLGSSAALCVGLLRLLSLYFESILSEEDLAKMANTLEEAFHGFPSGLDTSVIAYEKPLIFEKGKKPLLCSFNWQNEKVGRSDFFPFVLVDTLERKETFTMVEKTRKIFASKKGAALLQRFDALAKGLIKALTTGNIFKASEILMEAGSLLNDLGVVTQKASQIAKEILDLGALAVKITGSGGGGCLLALLDPRKREDQHQALVDQFGTNAVFKAYSA